MDSFEITFSGKSQVFESIFFAQINLNWEYKNLLVNYQSYNSVYNVNGPDNVL